MHYRHLLKALLLAAGTLAAADGATAQTQAFPGAEGFGRYTTG